ncbi:2Fe-2S iron-sulfur cluster binding domain-containing protein [Streptomyces sp. TRM43335]|uniref:2Fe-2S iron-sulfur cluster binding domain-containing protein n=1 Tax=Streptomyces taklimakanensis TaxID=2569853 RepID=A0A6G2BCF4_9ACTN|nr:2Fe-2S iron-sulfur cluster-binding protein [Streptomyces taklimakanensis]MTE19961.1 2Fe-2S iron-sulfur cluster binding domain-containing protein [Streptomyces taklimakanensis]
MRFHPLRVREVERLTDDAVAVTFDIPPEAHDIFRHVPGQHVTLRHEVDGTEVRRTYSVCAPAAKAPATPLLKVGIRLVEGGAFSTHALKELSVGDTIEVTPPTGRFTLRPRPGRFAAIVGGSGITPVLSIAATLLSEEPEAKFHLIRSDRTAASAMFLEEVAELKDRHPDRFHLVHTLSREERQAGPSTGRLDTERLTTLLPALLPVDDVDDWFLCGPHGLVSGAARALGALGVPATSIHQEIFHVDDASAGPRKRAADRSAPSGAKLTATLGGRMGVWPVGGGETLLETVLRNRSDAPYACKGGVCGTCRVKLVSGEVSMDRNFALEPDEVSAGYVLACQSRPVTEAVEVDFDA